MQFKIRRTSEYSGGSPCIEAVKIAEEEYEVEINTLEQLLDFSKRHGDLVFKGDPPSIEIYDDYRE